MLTCDTKRIMLNWLKRFKKVQNGTAPLPLSGLSSDKADKRAQLVANTLQQMANTRSEIESKIGEDRLQALADMILQKKQNRDDTSPAIQAKKIIAQMDKDRLSDFMRLMVQDNQTKH
jgi:hypothetical protein